MAKIDTSKIQGFDEMSAEDKLAAVLGMEIPDAVDMKQFVPKASFDKTSSDLAAAKKQLAAKMTDDEREKQEAQQAQADLQQKYEKLLRENTISKYKAAYLAQGYPEKLAEETATALADGDTEKVIANGSTFKAELEKSLKAELIKGTPKPATGVEGNAGDEKPKAVQLAEQIGKRNAATNEAAAKIRSQWTGGMTNG